MYLIDVDEKRTRYTYVVTEYKMIEPKLYEMYKDDITLSFYFSNDPSRELNDEVIMSNVAKRN